MQIESLENALLSAVNPLLKSIIRKFDVEVYMRRLQS